ncbi:MAG TPA: 50S ribosomal protein L3, partial [Pyrinomonadaceae bacterium]|nr:50S ribosomal protein L3 [Pyrinomonadaceae bacterium]
VVVQTKSAAGRDGYNAVQLGLVEDKPIRLKNVTKPLLGHFEKTGGGLPPTRVLKEIRLTVEPEASVGDQIKVDVFADGDAVDVVGKSKGRGFAGTIKRHKFSRGPESHGSMNVREPGSIGQSAYPSRVIKGTRSSGHMGDARVTVKGLTIAKIDIENNLIMVRGAVPGPNGGLVIVKKS